MESPKKSNAGRPNLKSRQSQIGIRVSETEKEKIKKVADSLGIGIADAIMQGIDLLAEKHGINQLWNKSLPSESRNLERQALAGTTIADCRAVHVAKKLYFIVNRSAIRQKKERNYNGLQERNY